MKERIRIFFSTALFSRLANGIGANAYSQLVTLFVQFASVPVLISYWGVEHYGIWIALSALPAYLASSNLGIANAAASEMTILSSSSENVNQNHIELKNVYHTACALTLIMTSVVFILSIFVIYSVSTDSFIFSELVPAQVLKSTLLLLVLYTLVTLFGGLWDAAFRSTRRYAKGTIFLHSIRLLEQIALLLSVVIFNADILTASAVLVAFRILGTLFVAGYLATSMPKIPFGLEHANIQTFKRLLPASLGFMAMPIGYAFFIQGMLIVAATFSSTYVAIFSTTRTLTSLGRQLVSIVAHASWPELSRAFGEGNTSLVKKLFLGSVGITSTFLMLYFVFLGFFGHMIFELWTSSKIDFDYSLFVILALAAIGGSFWNQCYILLASVNMHAKFSLVFVFVGICLLLTCYLMKHYGFSALNTLAVLPAAEFIMVIFGLLFITKFIKNKALS